MLIGIGLDVVELARVEQALERFGGRFVAKLMDPEEAARVPGTPDERALAVACAVAVKEAASKALGTGWSQGVRWRDVVLAARSPAGEVTLRLDARAGQVAARRGSGGRTRARVERRGGLVIGEVWLLS